MANLQLGSVLAWKAAPARSIALTTTAVDLVSEPCRVVWYWIANEDTGTVYVKLYNKTGATSADTPIATFVLGTLEKANCACMIDCSVALSVRACTGRADNDNTAPTANKVSINVAYQSA